MKMIAKTGTYWLLHISVAVTLAFLMTGDIVAAMGIGFLEPTVQAIVFYIHERVWERRREVLRLEDASVAA